MTEIDALDGVGKLSGYYLECVKTAIYPGAGTGSNEELAYLGLGIAGESGELVDVIKKIVRMGYPQTQHDLDTLDELRHKIRDELGDVFWYLGQLMRVHDWDIKPILEANLVKLEKRYENNQIKHR